MPPKIAFIILLLSRLGSLLRASNQVRVWCVVVVTAVSVCVCVCLCFDVRVSRSLVSRP